VSPALIASRREAGFALVAVLLAAGFLAMLAATMARAAHTEGAVTRTLGLAAAARAAADGAVRATIFALLTDQDAVLPRDGSLRQQAIGGVRVALSIQDETGLVDLNSAAPELLAALFTAESGAPPLAAALTSEVLRRRPRPATGEAGPPRAGASFRSVSELAAIGGMPVALFRRLASLTTVNSRQAGIDPQTAPRSVLLALPGAEPSAVESFLGVRAEYRTAARQLLPQAARFFAEGPHDVVRIAARAEAGGVVAERSASVRLLRGARPPFLILDWQPGRS